jgi:uncharacterized YigZ family protein
MFENRKDLLYCQTMEDAFTTIRRIVRTERKVRGSRFIATAAPAENRDVVDRFLGSVRKEWYDATHHCYAYRLGSSGDQFRAHDGGEPAGSAGKPILAAIEHAGLTDVVVIVTRYFGGTRLGIGGLGRAYGEAAAAALEHAERVTHYAVDLIRVSFPHAQVSTVMHLLEKYGARIVETTYDEEVHLAIEIRRLRSAELREALVNRTSGNLHLHSGRAETGGDP